MNEWQKGFDLDTKNLKALVEKTGTSIPLLADAIGMPYATLNSILKGRFNPNLNTVVALSNYFAVPVDFILGLTSEEDSEKLLEGYEAHYDKLRRQDYYLALAKKKDNIFANTQNARVYSVHAPYPYNLLDDIVRPMLPRDDKWNYLWQEVLTPDQEEGLRLALASLTEREQTIVRFFYGQETTLEATAKAFNLTRERIRQILAKSVRKLRHPVRFNLIQYGAEGYKRISSSKQRMLRLEEEDKFLDDMEQVLIQRRAFLENAMLLDAPRKNKEERTPVEYMDLSYLDLSVRSYNCMKRAGCNTIGDVIRIAKLGDSDLRKIRNLGRKSVEEIYDKLEEMTGIDYRRIALEADRKKEEVD